MHPNVKAVAQKSKPAEPSAARTPESFAWSRERPGIEGEEIDIRWVLGVLDRRRVEILALVALAVLIAGLYLLLAPAKYTAQAQLLIDNREQKIMAGTSVVPEMGADIALFESQLEILRSKRIAERTLRLVRAKTDGIALDAAAGAEGPDANPAAEVPVSETDVAALMKKMDIGRRGETYVIEVNVTDTDRNRAAQLANAVASAYLAEQLESRYAITRKATLWLEKQAEELRNKVRESEQKIQEYKAEHNLVAVGGLPLSERQIADYLLQVATARANVASAHAKLRQLEGAASDAPALMSSGRGMQSPVIIDYRKQLAELKRKETQLVNRFGASHPEVSAVRADIVNLTRQIGEELSRLVEGAREDYTVAKDQLVLLETGLTDLKRQLADSNVAAIGLIELERDNKATNELYTQTLARLKETQAQESLQTTNARIITTASPPTSPSSPKKALILAVSLLGSLGAGVLAAFWREAAVPSFRGKGDVERQLHVPPLAMIPDLGVTAEAGKASHGSIDAHLRSALADAVRSWPALERMVRPPVWSEDAANDAGDPNADALLSGAAAAEDVDFIQAMYALHRHVGTLPPGPGPKVVTVVSAASGDGRSLVAANLAAYAASVGKNSLLIDADLREAGLTRQLCPDPKATLADVVAGRSTLAAAVVRPDGTGYAFCPAPVDGGGPRPMELTGSPRIAELLTEARAAYDLVVIDTSSLGPYIDARALAAEADAVAFVIRAGRTARDAVRAALRPVMPAEPDRLAVVLNGAARADFATA